MHDCRHSTTVSTPHGASPAPRHLGYGVPDRPPLLSSCRVPARARRAALRGCLVLAIAFVHTTWAQQGDGDQFLDGIGETALVARYVLDGHERDASRNARHAMLRGTGARHVPDPRFGHVLTLPGGPGAYVQLPGLTIEGLETLSVSAWVRLESEVPGPILDLGSDARSHLFLGPDPTATNRYRIAITTHDDPSPQGPTIPTLPARRWVHLAVVLDAAHRTLDCYVDGERAGHAPDVTRNLEQVGHSRDGNLNRLFLGRAQDDNAPTLAGSLHDVRLYSIALTEEQIRGIVTRTGSGGGSTPATTPGERQGLRSPKGIAQPFAPLLIGVADAAVATAVGHLPRLPVWVPAFYRDLTQGPPVRVIWPSPTNTHPARTAGVYTVVGGVPGTPFQAKATITVRADRPPSSTPTPRLEPFPLASVHLRSDTRGRPTPFTRNRDTFLQGLAQTNPDRFLYMFRDAFGQPQPPGVEPLGGWDDQTTRLRGHATGHYLSAIAQACAGTAHDPVRQSGFRAKLDHLLGALHDLAQKSGNPAQPGGPAQPDPCAIPVAPGRTHYTSDLSTHGIRTDYWNWGRGYLSAYPPDQFILLEQGATYGGGNDQVWAPYYTAHKILAGLLDCHEVAGEPRALAIAEGMGHWIRRRLAALPPATRMAMWNRYIAGEYGGMNEVMARLARLTGNPGFLACAKLFDNTAFFFGDAEHTHGLARNVDTLRGRHANQHIPQVLGALETYRSTRDPDYWRIAENFWDICNRSYTYAIGGVAGARLPNNAECFPAQPDTLFTHGFASGGQNETCATYNLLKLTRQLFLFRPEGRYMDYYEQALYNHILASVAEHDAGNTYHVPLNPGARKQFGNAGMDGFTCCNGTALESHTKLQDSIYFRASNPPTLLVNLFVPSRVEWTERRITLTQDTDFPYSDHTRLTLAGTGVTHLTLQVRVPRWATRGLAARVNGQARRLPNPTDGYVTVGTGWNDGDVLELTLPRGVHLEPVMDQPNLASLFYGPILLAAEETAPRSDWRPVTLDATEPARSLSGDPGTLRFRAGDTTFKPFHETYGRHSVYLDVRLE